MLFIQIVTPNWLWCCAERWEHVDEDLFLLNNENEKDVRRNPPQHCLANSKKFFLGNIILLITITIFMYKPLTFGLFFLLHS